MNVQPHSGAQANAAVTTRCWIPGDRFLGMKLDHGGHLTHGMKINFSGRLYNVVAYGVREEDSLIDMDELAQIAGGRPAQAILAGWSAYPRQLDFARFREIADSVGAIPGGGHGPLRRAGGRRGTPEPGSLRRRGEHHRAQDAGRRRGGMILCREEFAKKIDSAMFPGLQGGPLMHMIGGKAVAMRIAGTELFRERQRRTRAGAKAVADEMLSAGVNVLSGGTDVHLVLADLRESELDGQQAEDRLEAVGITVNRNAVPFDPRPPAVSSGVRIGASALATRGLQVEDFREVGNVIGAALTGGFPDAKQAELGAHPRPRRALPAVPAARSSRRLGGLGPREERSPGARPGEHRTMSSAASRLRALWTSSMPSGRSSSRQSSPSWPLPPPPGSPADSGCSTSRGTETSTTTTCPVWAGWRSSRPWWSRGRCSCRTTARPAGSWPERWPSPWSARSTTRARAGCRRC